MDKELKELLRQGVEAARAGDKDEARRIFEQVVEEDEENIPAWLWMYRVVDDQDEKRICLTTVLRLDPDNERAQKLLDRLDARTKRAKEGEEIIPGISRRQLRIIIIGAAAFIIFICAIIMLISTSRGAQRAAEEAEATQLVRNITSTWSARFAEETAVAYELTQEANAGTATQIALVSPTPSPTNTRSVVEPPTWTPSLSPTPEFAIPTPLDFPDIPGTISGWGGRDMLSTGFLDVRTYLVNGRGAFSTVTNEPGLHVVIDPSTGGRIIYTQSFTRGAYGLFAVNTNGSQPEDLSLRWSQSESLIGSEMARYSIDGSQIVFVGRAQSTQTTEVYLLNMQNNGVARLTEDTADYTWPSLSPDGSRVAAVRNDASGANPGEDVVILPTGGRGAYISLTIDVDSFVESAPAWSPDGTQIAYAAAPSTSPNNHDIYIRPSDGEGVPTKLEGDGFGSDNLYPVFSPDGRYLAFSSNRTGSYDIYIYEFLTGLTWQLTNTTEEDYPGGWAN